MSTTKAKGGRIWRCAFVLLAVSVSSGVSTGQGGVCLGARVLLDFTHATLGTVTVGLDDLPSPRAQSYCWWFIAPGSPHPLTSAYVPEFLYHPNSASATADVFNISLQFISSFPDQISNCPTVSCSERVLIYDGLPGFLQAFARANISQSDEDSMHLTPLEEPGGSERVMASFSGADLRTAHLSVLSSLLTVVYLYSATGNNGFNVTVSAEQGSEVWPAEEEEGSARELYPSLSCSCVLEPCDCDHALFTTTPISSLYAALTTPTNHTPTCSGRLHHSSVYDSCSDSMFLFGGEDLSGNLCGDSLVQISVGGEREGVWLGETGSGDLLDYSLVRLIESGQGPVPSGRYHHTATLIRYSKEANDSSILVLGGFTLGEGVSSDLWLFNISSEEWFQLNCAPSPLASHTATYVEEEDLVIVIGGVSQDLLFRTSVMAYDIQLNSWEVWSPVTGGLVGVYGHAAAYSSVTQSVLVYGGVQYPPPDSSSLYSLHLPTRTWSLIQLQHQVQLVVFHSMVLLSNQQLIISGGLSVIDGQQRNKCGAKHLCSSQYMTFINLNSTSSAGKPTTSIQVSAPLSDVWGHTAVTDTHNRVIFVGGMTAGVLTKSVTVLHNVNNLCSLARNSSQCHALFDCVACINVTDLSLLECFNTQGLVAGGSGVMSEQCSLVGGVIEEPAESYSVSCGEFAGSCGECLLSHSMQCVWCTCANYTGCVGSVSDCPCQESVDQCPDDECSSPTCSDCLANQNCFWTRDSTLTSPGGTWKCSSSFNPSTQSMLDVCPVPCATWQSCSECVQAFSPQGGVLRCGWSAYSDECVSDVTVPLLCSSGECGLIVNTTAECPLSSCSLRTTCGECLSVPDCVWTQERGNSDGLCVGVSESGTYSDPEAVHYLECPQCPADCSGHGRCLPTLQCECDLGYIGEGCEVECLCNGHSDCVDETLAGREMCTDCQHNTQGSLCQECQPFHVGSAVNGGQCDPCLDFCNGNTDVCMSRADRARTAGVTNRTRLLELLGSGPAASEAVCVGCAVGTNGTRCEDCIRGYYTAARGSCAKCGCNGHSDPCDRFTGLCSCRDHTISISGIENQCSTCEIGYLGDPTDGHQCYRQQSLGDVMSLSLRSRQALFLAVGTDLAFTNSDISLTFVLLRGGLDLYSSTNSRAVKVEVDTNSVPGSHRVVISEGVSVEAESRSRRSVEEEVLVTNHSPLNFNYIYSSNPGHLVKRQVENGVLSTDNDSVVYMYHVDERLTLYIPYQVSSFGETAHYLTIFAREQSEFLFEYQQHVSRLNLYIFFGLFFATVTLMSSLVVALWGIMHFIWEQRQAALERAARERKSLRPLFSIMVYLHDGKDSTDPLACEKSLDSKDLDMEYREVDQKLRTKSLLILDGKPSYITKLRPGHSSSKGVRARKRKTKEVQVLEPTIADVWPVAMQPTADELASVHSLIVQLPTAKSLHHVLCAGSVLVRHDAEGTTELKEESMGEEVGAVKLEVRNAAYQVDADLDVATVEQEEETRL